MVMDDSENKPTPTEMELRKKEQEKQIQEIGKIVIALILAAIAIFFLNQGLIFAQQHPNWLSILGVTENPEADTYMVFTPKLCETPAWRSAWANSTNQNPQNFPLAKEGSIMQDYYKGKGIEISKVDLQTGEKTTCTSCGCRENYSYLVTTKIKSQTDLILEGFQPFKGAAVGFPFSGFRDVEVQQPSTIEECMQIPTNGSPVEAILGSERDNCLMKLSQPSNNEEACTKIENRGIYTGCIAQIAINYQNSAKCDSLSPGERDDCLLQVANSLGRQEICEKINSQLQIIFCRISTRFGLSKVI